MRQPPEDRPNPKAQRRKKERVGVENRPHREDGPGGGKRPDRQHGAAPKKSTREGVELASPENSIRKNAGPTPPEGSIREDAELIRSALRGKESAFAHLLKKYRQPVYSLALRMLGQAEDAEDTAQEAFIRAFQSLDSCDPSRPFQRWIYKIAYNLCVDRYRRRKPFAISLDQTVGDGEVPLELVDSAPAPDEVLGMRDEHRKAVELLSSLPPRYRVVVVLRHQEELSYEAIAEILGLPLGTVKARMHRAHNMLRRKLKRRET